MPGKTMRARKRSKIACPVCGAAADFFQSSDDVPHFGEAIIINVSCDGCGLNYNDVMAAKFSGPMEHSFEVDSPKALYTKVVKSSSATVVFEGLGVESAPGPVSEGLITNIEGMLERASSAVHAAASSAMGREKANAEKLLAEIAAASAGKKRFTLILRDPFGNSAILSPKARKKPIGKEEAEKLARDVNVIDL